MVANPKPEPLKIFISHSAKDLIAALRVHRALRDAGLRVWLREEDAVLGSSRHDTDEVLQASDLVLFLLSENSWADGGQTLDLDFARQGKKRVVPAFLQKGFPFIAVGSLAVHSGFLKERHGELIDSAEGLAKLIRGLQRLNRGETGTSLQESTPASEPVRGRLRVRRLVLDSVRCFESLDLPVTDGTGWITVLGDNAAGKSTVLRSLALGLCQESDAAALMRELPGSMIREGASSGTVRIELHDDEDDRDLSIVTSLRRDESTGEEILRKETEPAPFPWNKLFVCGY